jgi:AbrB family looped-hinge helix DNA binding protein
VDKPITTVLSTKGQVILPKAIRDSRGWSAGERLEVVDTEEGVLLRPSPQFEATSLDRVFGSLERERAPLTIEAMDAAVLTAARRDHAGG